jgi:hypothetical protein
MWGILSDERILCIVYNCCWFSPYLYIAISPMKVVAQLYLQALGTLFITSHDLQGYGGGI